MFTETTLRENSAALCGSTGELNEASQCHAPAPSLFPEAPLAVRKHARPTWRQWLHGMLLGGNIKRLGSRIFQRERARANDGKPKHKQKPAEWVEGDPENDRVALERILLGKDERRFDFEWIDDFVTEFGAEAREAVVRFVCERYGYQMPLPIPDPLADQIARQRLEKRAEDLLVMVGDFVEDLRRNREARK